MPYFFSDQMLIRDRVQGIKGEEIRHIRLARKIRPGETIVLQDAEYNRHLCTVTKVKNSFIEFKTGERINPPALPAHKIHVAVAAVKEKALDFILQKCTELGVRSIFLFESEFSQPLPKGSVKTNKLSRWNKIMTEACKQCERKKPPTLSLYEDIPGLLSNITSTGTVKPVVIHPFEIPKYSLEFTPDKNNESLLIIGPEGGFSTGDLTQLPKQYLNLGSLILRTETAVITAVSSILTLSAQG